MIEQTITVSQLTNYIKQIFEAEELLFNISVIGEVSSFKLVRGVAYFDLKDESSLISCVCFSGERYGLMKNGDKIIAKGTPNFYVKGGRLNFNVSKITPYGLGELYQNFLQIKEKLTNEGLFDQTHKKLIPHNVKRIGVITSETGAVIKDIITVATRRNPAVDIVLYPAKVQGAGTVGSIIAGLDFFENYDIDVVIIARGGGSMEDLNEFNSEVLARRIFAFTKPVVSAVGHETDFTICDFVCDIRGATPSVSAELVVENIYDKKQLFLKQINSIKSLARNFVINNERDLDLKKNKIINISQNWLNEFEYLLSLKSSKLAKFNPRAILDLGYAKIENKNGVVMSVKNVQSGDEIKISLKDGSVEGVIK